MTVTNPAPTPQPDDTASHGLTVEQVPRERYAHTGPRIPTGTEPCGNGTASAVTDVRRIPLGRVKTDSPTLRRIVPAPDGNRVPVAAFNASL